MSTTISVLIAIGVIAFVALKAFAESCLTWNHPLNLFLNGDPKKKRGQSDPSISSLANTRPNRGAANNRSLGDTGISDIFSPD